MSNAPQLAHDPVAYEQGAKAYDDGYADDVNPYQFGTALHDDWEAGWDSASHVGYHEWQSNERDKALDDPRRGQA